MKDKTIFVVTQPDVTHVVGGAPTIFIEMCNLLSLHGHTVYGICCSEQQGEPQGLQTGVHFVNLRYHYPENTTFPDAMNRIAEELHPELFIFFFPWFYTEAQLEKKFDCIPKILMFHSRPDFYFSAKKTMAQDLPFLCQNTVSQILFPSFYHLLPPYIQENPVVCIPNFSNSDAWIKPDEVRKKIVYLSRLDEFKQLFFLLRAFQLAMRTIPDWQLDIWGAGEEYFIRHLQKEIDRCHLSRQVHLMGISRTPLATLSNYDFCVFPSSFEGFSVGLTEALSVGLPAIGLKKASGVNEQITDQINGLLVDYSEEAFAQAIVELATDDEKRIRMSKAACESVRQYDKKIWDSRWLALVTDVMERRTIPEFSVPSNALPLFSIEEIMGMSQLPAIRKTVKQRIQKFLINTFIPIRSVRHKLKEKYDL